MRRHWKKIAVGVGVAVVVFMLAVFIVMAVNMKKAFDEAMAVDPPPAASSAPMAEGTVNIMPIVVTMGSRSDGDGIYVKWGWQTMPEPGQGFSLTAELYDRQENFLSGSSSVVPGGEFFVPRIVDGEVQYELSQVYQVRVVATGIQGEDWQADGGFLFLGEDR